MPVTGRPRRRLVAAIVGAAVAGVAVAGAHAAAVPGPPPGASTTVPPPDPARSAPWAWEPGIAADRDGTLWVAGNHCPLADQHGTCDLGLVKPSKHGDDVPVWRSADGGRSWHFLADPLRAPGLPGLLTDRRGGLDTDIAIAPVARPGRPALIYVVSAYGFTSSISVSGDNGRTWRVASAAGLPFQDRPWLATAGRCDLYLGYHPLTGAFDLAAAPRVAHYDGCRLYDDAVGGQTAAVPESDVLVEPASNDLTHTDQVFARLIAEGSNVYVAYDTCDTIPPLNQSCTAAQDRQSVHIAVSRDRGAHFTDVTLPGIGVKPNLNNGTWPMDAAGDAAGNLVVAVVDTHHVWIATSTDAGRHWRVPRASVDASLHWGNATVTSVAVSGRRIAVSWYDSQPAHAPGKQRWYLVVARSSDGGRTFDLTVLPPVLASTPAGQPLNDGLYDDFGTVITPNAVVLAYTESCTGHRPSERACPGPPAGTSVPPTTNVVRTAYLPFPEAPVSRVGSPPRSTRNSRRPVLLR